MDNGVTPEVNATIFYGKGKEAMRAGNPKRAIECFKAALRHNSDHADAQELLAKLIGTEGTKAVVAEIMEVNHQIDASNACAI